jgi:prevent-host-death family protein
MGTVLVVGDVPIIEASAHLAEVARSAARGGEVVYLTENGQRLAAIVPAAVAARIERDADDFKRKLAGAGMLAQVEPVVYAEPDECAREAASRRAGQGRPLSEYVADIRS